MCMWLNQMGVSHCLVSKSCPGLCYPMYCIMPGFSVLYHLPEIAQIHVHRVGNAIQPFHPLPPPSAPALNFSQYQGLFQWVSSSHQLALVLELQLQHSPSNEYSGLISFRSGLISLQSKGLLRVFSRTTVQNTLVLSLLYGPTLISIHEY